MLPNMMLIPVLLLCTLLILYTTPRVSASSVPLLLTPYIRQGHITSARNLSLVEDETGIIPTSYAGFITVDRILKNHLFFWFFPVLTSSLRAPILIWLSGGPGESSMVGLLMENGPLQLAKSGNRQPMYNRRNITWVNKFSMLYIDNPVGSGYSYSESGANGFRTTQDGFSKDLYQFIQQFYQMFPEFLQRDLYIGGQSYAGKYIPAFAYKIHKEIQSGKSCIPLKGLYMGAPLLDARVQLFIMFDAYYTLGYITSRELSEFKKNLTEKLPQSKSQKFLYDIDTLLYPITHNNIYTFEKEHNDEVKAVMTSHRLRRLLHVGSLPFEAFNDNVFTSVVKDDLFVSSIKKLPELMDNYKFLIYTGDMDGIISNPEIETVLESLSWSLQSAYNSSTRQVWLGENNEIKGFYTRVSTLCRVVIRRAGHRAAYDQPDITLEMMDNYVNNGCLN